GSQLRAGRRVRGSPAVGRPRDHPAAAGSGQRAPLAAARGGRPMTAGARPGVVYVLPDKMGGAMNLVANLLAYRTPDGFDTDVVLTHNRLTAETRFGGRLQCDRQSTFEYTLPIENLHAVLRR